MAIANCTISTFNSNENFGDNWGAGEISTITFDITPDVGYVVSASDFSWVDGGVSLSSQQPIAGQYRYQSDTNNFSYNLTQTQTQENIGSAVPEMLPDGNIGWVIGFDNVLDNNSIFPRYAIFRNSSTPLSSGNIVKVDVIMWDNFTMPNGGVSLRLDILGSSTQVVIPVVDIEEEIIPPILSGNGMFNISPVFVSSIEGQGNTSNLDGTSVFIPVNGQQSSNIIVGGNYQTTWDTNVISGEFPNNSFNTAFVPSSYQQANGLYMFNQAYPLAYWNSWNSTMDSYQIPNGTFLSRNAAYFHSHVSSGLNMNQIPNWLTNEDQGINKEGEGIVRTTIGLIDNAYPHKSTDDASAEFFSQPTSNNYRSTVAGHFDSGVPGSINYGSFTNKTYTRPNWESLPQLITYSSSNGGVSFDGGRFLTYTLDEDGFIDSTSQFSPYNAHFSQTMMFTVRSTDGFAINKNLFTFPYGLSPIGFTTGVIGKPFPDDAINTSTMEGGGTVSATEAFYYENVFQGNTDIKGLAENGVWNTGDLGINMPTIVRQPVVYLTNNLTEPRTDIIDYIELHNSIDYAPPSVLSSLSQQQINNSSVISSLMIMSTIAQSNYSQWANNSVEIRIKFNPNFTHDFSQGDGSYYEDVKILIAIEPNSFSAPSGGDSIDDFTTGFTSDQGATLTNIDSTSSWEGAQQTIALPSVNKRGEADEQNVLEFRGIARSNTRSNVASFRLSAPSGKYIVGSPRLTANNKQTSKIVKLQTTNIVTDSNNRITSYDYDVKYKSDKKTTSSDKIGYNITADYYTVPVNDGVKEIKSVNVGKNKISPSGGTKTIAIKGNAGAEFEIEVNSVDIESLNPINTVLNDTLADYNEKDIITASGNKRACVRGKLNSNGNYSFNVVINKITTSAKYIVSIIAINDSKLKNNLKSVYEINQYANPKLTLSASTGSYAGTIHINGAASGSAAGYVIKHGIVGKLDSLTSTITFILTSQDGSNISAKAHSGSPFFTQKPKSNGIKLIGSDFTNSDPYENGGMDVDIQNSNITGLNSQTVTITYELKVNKWGTKDVDMNFLIDDFVVT